MDRSAPVSVPRLHTQRLVLREYRLEDFDAFAAHHAAAETAAFLGSADRQAAWRIFGGHAGLWLLHGAGWWIVQVRETGEVVGHVGAFFRECMTGIEIGWNTYHPFWGQGFASEAAAEAMRYALEVRGEPQVKALIASGNARSIRVALRLGLQYDSDVELYGTPIGCFTRQREG